jgi:predicted dehydrogenase
MIRVGVVGMGNIGKLHAAVYRDDPLSELVAVCDAVAEKAEAAARAFGVRAYTSLQEMLDREEIDLVGVCTGGIESGSDHYEPTMQAFAAGKMVLGEKPICNDIERARQMVAAAREKNLHYGINLNHRFSPLAVRAKQWCQEGRLGDLLFCNMALWVTNPRDDPYFHIRVLHPHSIDVMRYFCGPVRRVQAFFSKAPGRQGWSTVSVNLEFENGALGHLCGSYDMPFAHGIERCEVAGTKGRFVIDNVIEDLTFYPHGSDERIHVHMSIFSGVTHFNDTFKLRIHRFLEQVTQGAKPEEIEGSGAEALAAQEIIEAAIRSHENGNCAVEVGGG